MSTLRGFAARLRALVRRRAAERELDDEIRFHLECETERWIGAGLRPDEARRRALVAFGGVTRAKEAHREVRALPWVESLARDLRYSLRALRRSPALTGAVVTTMALSVGATTAIFSAVNAVVLRPLPFAQPDRLVMLWESNPEKGWVQQVAAPANMLDWRERVRAFEDVAAYNPAAGDRTLVVGGEPRRVRTAIVTGNFFSVLGVRAEHGRTLRDAETWASGTPVAVISDRLWRTQLGGDPRVVGRTLAFDGRAVQVVGIMPRSFGFPDERVDVWFPVGWDRADRAQTWFRRAHWPRPIARLRAGVTPEQANAELQQVVRALQVEYPETNRVMGAGLTPMHEFLVGDTRLPLLVLLAAVGLLLLIACANVGNLLLVRAVAREREVALRLALGAARGRLIGESLTESIVLSLLGGAAGLALGWWGTKALVALEPEGLLRVADIGVDWTVVAFVVAVTTVCGLVFGTVPASWRARLSPAAALRGGGRTLSDGLRTRRWGDRLVVAEVAIALLLTIGAGLLVRSVWRLEHVLPGFDPANVLTADVRLPGVRYDSAPKLEAFFDETLRRLRAQPGVVSAAAVRQLPRDGYSWSSDFSIAGRAPDQYGSEVQHREVTPDYFRTMRVPLLRGRAFTDADRPDAPPVVIINEALAREFFRGENPIGQRLCFDQHPDSTSVWRTIVGVVGSEHQSSLATEPRIEIFQPLAQSPGDRMILVARASGDPAALAPVLRRTVGELDPEIALGSVRTMDEVFAASMALPRFIMTLLVLFAAVGLVLAAVGVYGVLAQLARARTREMGIRVALGARASQVRWLVVRHALGLVLLGVAIGAVASLGATRALRGVLYDVPPSDPLTFAVVSALLAGVAVLAAWLPAVRASRADPTAALREE